MGRHVLIVDTNHITRAGLRAIFTGNADITQVSEASTIEDFKRSYASSTLHCIVIHQSLITNVQLVPEGQQFIVLADELDKNILLDSYERGASAYLSEKSSLELLLKALYLKRGEFLLDPSFTPWILSATSKDTIPSTDCSKVLTSRELEIFNLLRSGMTYRSIADRLSIAVPTVKTHVAHIFRKLNIKRRPGKTFYSLEEQSREPVSRKV